MSGAARPPAGPPPKQRGNPSLGDILRSVGVLSLIVLGLWAFGLLLTHTPDDPVRDVDYATTADSARDAATYPLLAPGELPEGWRVNAARFEPGEGQAWHLGVLTDDDRYIGLEQEKRSAAEMVAEHAAGAKEAGAVEADGVAWQRYDGPDERITLVSEAAEATTLVTTGIGSLDDLTEFLGTLAAE
ncbi:MAG: DUF4245 domain-containing protein [Aeromicrobium sp.]|uniref:DUF4245 domain-containing protein n=1 Tax=Aeromicrobium sp. TaxID=1871063 RepID=UPI0039E5E02D